MLASFGAQPAGLSQPLRYPEEARHPHWCGTLQLHFQDVSTTCHVLSLVLAASICSRGQCSLAAETLLCVRSMPSALNGATPCWLFLLSLRVCCQQCLTHNPEQRLALCRALLSLSLQTAACGFNARPKCLHAHSIFCRADHCEVTCCRPGTCATERFQPKSCLLWCPSSPRLRPCCPQCPPWCPSAPSVTSYRTSSEQPHEWVTGLPMLAAWPGSILGRRAAQSGPTQLTALSTSPSVMWASVGQPLSWPPAVWDPEHHSSSISCSRSFYCMEILTVTYQRQAQLTVGMICPRLLATPVSASFPSRCHMHSVY